MKTVLLSIKGTDVKNALCVGVHMDNIRSQHTLCKRMTDVCAGHIALVYRGHK